MFFHRHTDGQQRQDGPSPEQGPRPEQPHTITIIDGANLYKKLPDDPSMAVGQLILEHQMGMIDYNDMIDRKTRNGNYKPNTASDAPEEPAPEPSKGEELHDSSADDSADVQQGPVN